VDAADAGAGDDLRPSRLAAPSTVANAEGPGLSFVRAMTFIAARRAIAEEGQA